MDGECGGEGGSEQGRRRGWGVIKRGGEGANMGRDVGGGKGGDKGDWERGLGGTPKGMGGAEEGVGEERQ